MIVAEFTKSGFEQNPEATGPTHIYRRLHSATGSSLKTLDGLCEGIITALEVTRILIEFD